MRSNADEAQTCRMDRNSSHGSPPPKEKERRDSKAERPSSPPSRVDALRAEDEDVRRRSLHEAVGYAGLR